jgi:precorrin-6Y C5,15-methyltransferase (decarboxylating) CbiT subunit
MITKEEIRVIAISKLRLKNDSIVWDIGAGCGSISIEAALLAKKGKVFAIEKEKSRIMHIEKNKKRFAALNLKIIHKSAPYCLKKLPLPDAVFIGGGGKDIYKILEVSSKRIRSGGRIVVNAITIDTLMEATKFFSKRGWKSEIVSVNIAKTKNLTNNESRTTPDTNIRGQANYGIHIFNAYNPIFIIVGEKP